MLYWTCRSGDLWGWVRGAWGCPDTLDEVTIEWTKDRIDPATKAAEVGTASGPGVLPGFLEGGLQLQTLRCQRLSKQWTPVVAILHDDTLSAVGQLGHDGGLMDIGRSEAEAHDDRARPPGHGHGSRGRSGATARRSRRSPRPRNIGSGGPARTDRGGGARSCPSPIGPSPLRRRLRRHPGEKGHAAEPRVRRRASTSVNRETGKPGARGRCRPWRRLRDVMKHPVPSG